MKINGPKFMIKLLFLVLLCALLGYSQETQPRPNLPFDQANAIVRYDCTSVYVNEDGTGESLHRYRVALLSDRAIRQYSQDETVYNLGYDTVIVVAARIYLPDGKIVEVDS